MLYSFTHATRHIHICRRRVHIICQIYTQHKRFVALLWYSFVFRRCGGCMHLLRLLLCRFSLLFVSICFMQFGSLLAVERWSASECCARTSCLSELSYVCSFPAHSECMCNANLLSALVFSIMHCAFLHRLLMFIVWMCALFVFLAAFPRLMEEEMIPFHSYILLSITQKFARTSSVIA